MDTKILDKAEAILKNIIYVDMATVCPDGKPWISPLRFNYDSDLNIYWASSKNNQHSKNIRENKSVSMVIYDSTVPEGEGEGVYLEGEAYELDDTEEIREFRRMKKGPENDSPDDFIGDAERRIYKVVPSRAWINDAEIKDGKFIRDFKIEIPLDELRSRF